MSTQIDVKEIERKSFRYFMQDGLGVILMGLVFTDTGALIQIFTGASIQSTGIVFVILLIAIILFIRFSEAFRKRYIYPRIGYAQFLPRDDAKKLGMRNGVFALSAIAVSFICCFLFGDWTDPILLFIKWFPTLNAVIFLQGLIYLHSKLVGTVPWVYWVYAVVAIGLGLLFSILEFDGFEGTSYWCLSLGAFFILYGIIQFVLFLRKYPMPAAEVTNGEK